jgi:cytochrome c-type biogenesis protein CcmH/NrfG
MENEQRSPGTSLVAEPLKRRSPVLRRVLIATVAAGAVVGGLLVLLPEESRPAPPPAPGPKAQALTAVTAGVPAALPDLAALIGDREARVRVRPRDARSWAVLGVAYVEQGRRTGDTLYYPRAEEALRTSLKVRAKGNDASAVAMDGLAALANERRDFRTARSWGEAAVKLAPKRWTTYPLLIDAYTGLGDYKATKRTLDKLLELHS